MTEWQLLYHEAQLAFVAGQFGTARESAKARAISTRKQVDERILACPKAHRRAGELAQSVARLGVPLKDTCFRAFSRFKFLI